MEGLWWELHVPDWLGRRALAVPNPATRSRFTVDDSGLQRAPNCRNQQHGNAPGRWAEQSVGGWRGHAADAIRWGRIMRGK